MKTIKTLALLTAIGLGCAGQSVQGGPVNVSGSGSLHPAIGGNALGNKAATSAAGSVSASQNISRHGLSVDGSSSVNSSTDASATVSPAFPNLKPEIKNLAATIEAKRDKYEAEQKELLDTVKDTSAEQRAFIRERLQNNRKAFQADLKQLRKELLEQARQIKEFQKSEIDGLIDQVK